MNQAGALTIKGMNFPKLNQIGILVKDIAQSVAYYSKLLGVKPWHWYNPLF